MPASDLIERVSALIASHLDAVPADLRTELQGLQRRLREPVRVAVVGKVNSGKSTMVNALLGQRIAPTDVSECTRLVTWFRYGHPQRLVVERNDGTEIETQLTTAGTLPDTLPVPVDEVASLHAFLANEVLRWMTLIDTPGIGSVHAEYSATTEDLLDLSRHSHAAADKADAIVFLFNQVMMADELQMLQLFRQSAQNESGRSAANAVGVLSKADQLGDGSRDPWNVAVELAGHYAGQYKGEVATVVPVIGLVAETSETATLTESHMKHLHALAEMEEKAFGKLLWSADRFVTADAPAPTDARERLLEMLDLYGVKRAVDILRAGDTQGAVALRRHLSSLSGIADVKRMLSTYFHEQDHVLKVRSVLDILERLTYRTGADAPADGGGQLAAMRAAVEALRLDPVMHPVAELEAWHDCLTGRVALPPEERDELARLFAPGTLATRLGVTGDDPAALKAAAQDGMVRWRTFMVTEANPAQAGLARVVLRSYQLIWTTLQ